MADHTPPNPPTDPPPHEPGRTDPTAPGRPDPPPGYQAPEHSTPTEGRPLSAETEKRRVVQRSSSVWLAVIGLLGVAIIFALIAIFGGFFEAG